MKIAFFSDCYIDLTGGITSSISAQKTALEKAGHTVYIFSSGYPRTKKAKQKLAKQHIFQVPSCRIFFYKLTPLSRRPRIIEKWILRQHPEIQNFDIIYIHYEAGCSIAGIRLGKQLHIPTVQVMHGREDMGETNIIPYGFRTIVAVLINWFHSWYLPHPINISRDDYCANSIAKAKMWTLMVNHANAADLVLTPSEHFRKRLLHYGVTKTIKVFPNGYPDYKYSVTTDIKQLQPNDTLKIIWHSRVSAEKRMMPFLNALTQVHGKYHLNIYGGGGDYFRAKRFAKRHHLNVTFRGNAPFNTIQQSLMASHLDVLVSYDFDTFGMTLIEAEAHNVPVLFCDPDMKEIVPKGSYLLSKDPSPVAIAAALNELIEHPERIATMSKIMFKHHSEVLISNRIKLLEQYFNDIIKK